MSLIAQSAVWRETQHTPGVLRETLAHKQGFDDVLRVLSRSETKRIVAIGNGASLYAAQALWLASLMSDHPAEVVAIPAGILSTGSIQFREGDVVLALSVSGELSDLVIGLPTIDPVIPRIAVTCSPNSSIASLSDAVAQVSSAPLDALTHTHSYCGAVATCLSLWAELVGDARLGNALDQVADAFESSLDTSQAWAETTLDRVEVPDAVFAFGPGVAWAAALESALLVKEIAQIPSEGVESREASTAVMTTLRSGHLVLSMAGEDDATSAESETVCASRGASVVRLPGLAGFDRRLSPILSFPAAASLALNLAARKGLNSDAPSWARTYESTARK